MGKKSKKKGGTDKATARKERRGQQQQQQQQQLQDGDGNFVQPLERRDREYFVGDRVWFWDERNCFVDNPDSYRGFVHNVGEGVEDGMVAVVPLQSIIYGDPMYPPFMVPKKKIFPDFCDFMLRFGWGDEIICPMSGRLATVERPWPITKFKAITSAADLAPLYSGRYSNGENLFHQTVSTKSDHTIERRPSSFRFKQGDSVVFCPFIAIGNGKTTHTLLERSSKWIRGTVTAVDVDGAFGTTLYYAAYECAFVIGVKQHSCLIRQDDDEHIAKVDADPRKRLFDAIEQHCNHEHLSYLVRHFSIDVATFRDLVVAKAIEFASYEALAWLQFDCDIDVLHIKDELGYNLLHMIAKSPHATRFFRDVGDRFGYDYPYALNLGGFDTRLFDTRSNDQGGETWLQILVRRGSVEALDAALSPCGLAWDLSQCNHFGPEVLESLSASISEKRATERPGREGYGNSRRMQCILDSFLSFRGLYQQYLAFNNVSGGIAKDERLADLVKGGAKQRAKLLARFYFDWKDYPSQNFLSNHFTNVVGEGSYQLFKLLYEADERLFNKAEKYRVTSSEDINQLIQPELVPGVRSYVKDHFYTDIFTACIVGADNHQKAIIEMDHSLDPYLQSVQCHAVSCNKSSCPSLIFHLSCEKAEEDKTPHDRGYASESYFSHRLRLLEDDDNVEGRRKILDYLLLQYPSTKLDILQAIKHRQCWVIRFLVDKKYLKLDAQAATDTTLVENASILLFLDSGNVPSTMTIKCCLCFAAVQYDDLQSLQWLCESFGAPVQLVGGWNLLHFVAFMGRVEILVWLSSRPEWSSLVSRACVRKPFHGFFDVHIAASCGHISLRFLPREFTVGRNGGREISTA